MTRQEMAEFLSVPLNYIENFITIRTKQGGLQKLKLNPAQRMLYEAMKKEHDEGRPMRFLILKARQLGFSTVIEALFFHDAATRFLVKTLIVAHEEDSTTNLFRMNKRFFDNLPPALKPMQKNSNAQEIVFENPTRDPDEKKANPGLMSSIRCVTATGGGVGRGDTFTNVHASEAAFWRNMNETLDSILQAVPDDPDTAVVIESTPNGFNEFKTLWDDAVAGKNGFTPLFFPWFLEPGYRKPVPPGTEFAEDERQLQKAYGLTEEQLMWRRWCIATNLRGDSEKFKQEYPSCPEEAFLTSGRPVFNNEMICRMLQNLPQPVRCGEFTYDYDGVSISNIRFREDAEGIVKIYQEPGTGVPYVLGGDPAGEGCDFFVGMVLDNTSGKQVAVLRHQMDEVEYARQMYCLGMFYNKALIGIENNYSTYPTRELERLRYPKMYVRQNEDSFTHNIKNSYGFVTTSSTRKLIVAELVTVMLEEPQTVVDRTTLEEMLVFAYNEQRRPEAMAGAHDDCVMALAIAHHIRPQQRYEVRLADEKRVEWSKDQWEDYNRANREQRQQLLKLWGKPVRK